jgi:hypothetical protein
VVRGKTCCALCGTTFSAADEIVAFPHFISDETHPLWRFSDAATHQSCFVDWDRATEFRSAYNEIWPKIMPDHPRYMQLDGSIVEIDATRNNPVG